MKQNNGFGLVLSRFGAITQGAALEAGPNDMVGDEDEVLTLQSSDKSEKFRVELKCNAILEDQNSIADT